MEPNKYESGAELPEPMLGGPQESTPVASPEITPSFNTPQPSSANPQPVIAADPIQQTVPVQPQPQPVQPSPQLTAALIADDADLIEKEWVLKAKAIVAQTAHDPNLQTKEVGKMKAEYLKKRYNKQLKIDEN